MNKYTEISKKANKDWLQKDSLDEVVIRLHKMYLENNNLLTGDILGTFVKRLLESEVEVGGPYVSKDDLYINTLIIRFFRVLGTPLDQLENYMNNKQYKPKNNYQEAALKLPTEIEISYNPYSNRRPNEVIKNLSEFMNNLSSEVRKLGITFLDKIIELDKRDEISLISSYTLSSLIKRPTKREVDISYKLGEANIHAWIAYTIYDDFIDEEGSPILLSLANIMHRRSYEIYIRQSPSMVEMINSHYDSVDNSNLWELKNCRAKIKDGYIFLKDIPEYNDCKFLAERAVGHVLGPKMLISGRDLSSHQKSLIFEALNKYLIAKQINDDIVDWKIDLSKGHLSYVVSKLLKSSETRTGKHNIESLTTKLQHTFWENTLQECLLFALNELENAEKFIIESKAFKSKNLFTSNLIYPLKISIENSIKNHQNDKLFLETYIA